MGVALMGHNFIDRSSAVSRYFSDIRQFPILSEKEERELAASLAILLLGIVGVTWIAARIYRVGILMTGKRPTMKELGIPKGVYTSTLAVFSDTHGRVVDEVGRLTTSPRHRRR
jgi:hypothetical protein